MDNEDTKDIEAVEVEVEEVGGKGELWKPSEERMSITRKGGLKIEFVDYWPKFQTIRIWEVSFGGGAFKIMKVEDFSVADLQAFGVWELLSPAFQEEISKGYVQVEAKYQQDKQDAHEERMEKRKGRADYVGIPREIECSKCGDKKAVAPANVIKYSEAANLTIEEWVKQFKCSTCEPRHRGRQANEKWVGLPREIHCSEKGCTYIQKQHPSMTDKMAKEKGITFEEFVSTWKCKAHREKKVHHFTLMKEARLAREAKEGKVEVVEVKKPVNGAVKGHRGRQASGKYDGMSSELHCSAKGCKFTQKQHPSLTITAAEKKGKTFKEYCATWKCKEHREKRVRG